MKPTSGTSALPPDLLARASIAGNECAWPIADIPALIEAARAANLVSIGGQLQFRLTDGRTRECYWMEVDTYKSVDEALPWNERVVARLKRHREISPHFKSVSISSIEGRKVFPRYLDKLLAHGRDLVDAMRFVWYVLGEDEASAKGL